MVQRDLLNKVLGLPKEDQLDLVRELISRLDGPADPDAGQAWVTEIERRVRDVQNGTVKPLDWEQVRKRIEARLSSLH